MACGDGLTLLLKFQHYPHTNGPPATEANSTELGDEWRKFSGQTIAWFTNTPDKSSGLRRGARGHSTRS